MDRSWGARVTQVSNWQRPERNCVQLAEVLFFGPCSSSSLVLHLDAALLADQPDGSLVSFWRDQSGHGHHARRQLGRNGRRGTDSSLLIGGAAVEEKRMRLVLSMITLFANLMLDLDDNLSEGSFFEDFMSNYNLLTKNN